jgi:hypothetical protein
VNLHEVDRCPCAPGIIRGVGKTSELETKRQGHFGHILNCLSNLTSHCEHLLSLHFGTHASRTKYAKGERGVFDKLFHPGADGDTLVWKEKYHSDRPVRLPTR